MSGEIGERSCSGKPLQGMEGSFHNAEQLDGMLLRAPGGDALFVAGPVSVLPVTGAIREDSAFRCDAFHGGSLGRRKVARHELGGQT